MSRRPVNGEEDKETKGAASQSGRLHRACKILMSLTAQLEHRTGLAGREDRQAKSVFLVLKASERMIEASKAASGQTTRHQQRCAEKNRLHLGWLHYT